MKKITLAVLALSSSLGSFTALADNHTISMGYAQASVQNLKNIHGGNLQYRYEWNSPVSGMGSFTFMKGDKSAPEGKAEAKYYSLLAGPAYRINDYISLYGLAGAAYSKGKFIMQEDKSSMSANSTRFAYAAGVVINPTQDLSVNIGYEGTTAKMLGEKMNINGFNVGVGYRF